MNICGKGVHVQGGLIRTASLDGEKYNGPGNLEVFLDCLKKCRTRIDVFTFLQSVPETKPKFSYPMEWDNLAVLPVTTFDHWWMRQIRSYPRNRARQAEKKGVVLREVPCDEALIEGICAIYNECPIRQGKKFPHYGITIEKARNYASTFLDRSIYVGAFLDNTMIGFLKLVMDETSSYACIVHILSMVQHKDKAPTNALLSRAVRICAERQISHLVYERFSYGNKKVDSLGHFKEVNGFQRMDLPRYYVPLNAWGGIALRLGLHRRLSDRIPESLAAKFRELRKAWYYRKFQSTTEV